jgi:hypothetical protein
MANSGLPRSSSRTRSWVGRRPGSGPRPYTGCQAANRPKSPSPVLPYFADSGVRRGETRREQPALRWAVGRPSSYVRTGRGAGWAVRYCLVHGRRQRVIDEAATMTLRPASSPVDAGLLTSLVATEHTDSTRTALAGHRPDLPQSVTERSPGSRLLTTIDSWPRVVGGRSGCRTVVLLHTADDGVRFNLPRCH